MVPAAILLNGNAPAGGFNALFFTVQLEYLTIGVVQLILLRMNFRTDVAHFLGELCNEMR